MGLCLETESQPSNNFTIDDKAITSPNNQLPNSAGPESQTPQTDMIKKPVVFVIGGPGTGKISHSERLAENSNSQIVHINLYDVLKQAFDLTKMDDILKLPSNEVTVLLEAIMMQSEQAKGFIISGFPRDTNDIQHYLERIGRMDGTILLNWHESAIVCQIDYGAKLGHVVKSEAQAELQHFKKEGIPVAEYFDFKQLLYVVTGERVPDEVFADFVVAFDRILERTDDYFHVTRPTSKGSYRNYKADHSISDDNIDDLDDEINQFLSTAKPVIYIIGGPGTSKARRIQQCLKQFPHWKIISAGELLWGLLSVQKNQPTVVKVVGDAMEHGDFVAQDLVVDLVVNAIIREDADTESENSVVEGFFVIGFPRNIFQAQHFEERMSCRPPAVLIDCSELELGRNLGQRQGRLDDHLDAYKRRLQLYREQTLPLLKAIDDEKRLRIVDGDAPDERVVLQLQRCLSREIEAMRICAEAPELANTITEAETEEEQEAAAANGVGVVGVDDAGVYESELYRAVPSGEEYDTTSMTIADENSLRRPLELPDEVAKSQTAALEVLERALLRIEDPKCQ